MRELSCYSQQYEISPRETKNDKDNDRDDQPPQVGDIPSQIPLTAKKTKQDYFQKLNSRINGDLLLWDLTLIKANLAVFLSLQADVIVVGWQGNTNDSGKCCQSIVSSRSAFLSQKKGFWNSGIPKLN